jgi:hypothetical protein
MANPTELMKELLEAKGFKVNGVFIDEKLSMIVAGFNLFLNYCRGCTISEYGLFQGNSVSLLVNTTFGVSIIFLQNAYQGSSGLLITSNQ